MYICDCGSYDALDIVNFSCPFSWLKMLSISAVVPVCDFLTKCPQSDTDRHRHQAIGQDGRHVVYCVSPDSKCISARRVSLYLLHSAVSVSGGAVSTQEARCCVSS